MPRLPPNHHPFPHRRGRQDACRLPRIALVGGMIDALSRDYANTTAMIIGAAPEFDAVLASINEIDCTIT